MKKHEKIYLRVQKHNNMKTKSLILLAFLMASLAGSAQKIKTTDGDLSALKNETSINIEFKYDGMSVGKFDNEADYIAKKKEEYNKKESGKGDTWAKQWVDDREFRYEPKFLELFQKSSGMTVDKNAKYTLIFHTKSTEPGFNIGITRKNASIDGEVTIVETANRDKKIATITVDNAPGQMFGGMDFDTGVRILEAYANAGKKIGKYIK